MEFVEFLIQILQFFKVFKVFRNQSRLFRDSSAEQLVFFGFSSTEYRSDFRLYWFQFRNFQVSSACFQAVPEGNLGATEFFKFFKSEAPRFLQFFSPCTRSGFRDFFPDLAPDFFPFFGGIVFNLDSKSSPPIYSPCMPAWKLSLLRHIFCNPSNTCNLHDIVKLLPAGAHGFFPQGFSTLNLVFLVFVFDLLVVLCLVVWLFVLGFRS